MNSAIQKPKYVRVSSVLVKHARICGVGHEHIGTDADRDFIVALSMKAQAVRLSSPQLLAVNLH